MSNHIHQQMSYSDGATKFSHVMRVAHGTFGMRFNRAFGRSGKVANERPKTPLVGGTEAEMKNWLRPLSPFQERDRAQDLRHDKKWMPDAE